VLQLKKVTTSILTFNSLYKIDSSYVLDSSLLCGLCFLPIPTNVYTGKINKKFHPASLTVDHILPKSLGGGDTNDNLQYAHRYCNQSKNNKLWTTEKQAKAIRYLERFFSDPLESTWFSLTVKDGLCLVKECARVARSGDYFQYCQVHAKELNEDSRSALCKNQECGKQSRSKSNGYCMRHSRLNGVISSDKRCEYPLCSKLVQRKYSRSFCQKHVQEVNGVKTYDSHVKEWAAHCRVHRENRYSRVCIFCVRDFNVIPLDLEEVRVFSTYVDKLSARKIADYFKISKKSADSFYKELEVANNV